MGLMTVYGRWHQLRAYSPFLCNHSVRREAKYIEPAISDKAKVCRRCDCYSRVEKGRVFHAVALEALGSEFEHCAAPKLCYDIQALENRRIASVLMAVGEQCLVLATLPSQTLYGGAF